MRGKGKSTSRIDFPNRITPAYAGKRCNVDFPRRAAEDHPRLCGEKVRQCLTSYVGQGSPPPMRGKGSEPFQTAYGSRITPAYAGKSTIASTYPSPYEDHPRLCGEKAIKSASHSFIAGSPPPMRGKASCGFFVNASNGITPAYAGKRLFLRR